MHTVLKWVLNIIFTEPILKSIGSLGGSALAGGGRERALDAPSRLEALSDRVLRQPALIGPLLAGHRAALEGQELVGLAVVRLLPLGDPAAVVGRIKTVIAYAVQSQPGFPSVCQRPVLEGEVAVEGLALAVLRLAPFIADSYATCAVMMVILATRIVATSDDAVPDVI
jgi:hypothetical protein